MALLEKYKGLHEWIQEYIKHLIKKEVSNNTLTSYVIDLKYFEKFIKERFNIDIPEVTEEHIIQYQLYMRNKNWASGTRARKTITIKDFYEFASKKFQTGNPAKEIITPKIEKRKPKFLTKQEVQKLLDATKTKNEPFRSRDRLIILLFATVGLRVGELVKIKLTDLNSGFLRVTGKRNKERVIKLNKDIIKAWDEYLKVRPNVSEYLFLNKDGNPITVRGVQYIIEQYLQQTNLDRKGYSVHTLRHTAATLILKGTRNMRLVQNILGHEHISTTQIYAHVDEEMLNEAAIATEGLFA